MGNLQNQIMKWSNTLSFEDDSREWLGKITTVIDPGLLEQDDYPAYESEIRETAMQIAGGDRTHVEVGAGNFVRKRPDEIVAEAIERRSSSWGFTSITGKRTLMKHMPTSNRFPFGGVHAQEEIRTQILDVVREYRKGVIPDDTRKAIDSVLDDEIVRQRTGVPLHRFYTAPQKLAPNQQITRFGVVDSETGERAPPATSLFSNSDMIEITYAFHRASAEAEYKRILPSFLSEMGVPGDDKDLTLESRQKAEAAALEAASKTVGQPQYHIWFNGELIRKFWQPTIRNTVASPSTTTAAAALQFLGSSVGPFMQGVFAEQNFGPNLPAQEMTDRPFEQLWQDDEMPNEVIPQ